MQTMKLDSLSLSCILPPHFDEAIPLNTNLSIRGKEMVNHIFPFGYVARLLQTPRGTIIPLNIREQWKNVVIPVENIDYRVDTVEVCDNINKEKSAGPECPGLYSPSLLSVMALGLHFIQAVREQELTIEELDRLYGALVFWKDSITLENLQSPLEFRPRENDGITMNKFAQIIKVKR